MYRILLLAIPFFIYASDNINLENKNLDIKIVDPKMKTIKTKEDYKDNQALEKEPEPFEKDSEEKKSDGIDIDGSVDIDKEKKSIDKININMGTKF